jgi:methylated-DNA-protein-cysteine methyltransferase-like protein
MANGSVTGGVYADVRKALLVAEGVVFLTDGRVDMGLCGVDINKSLFIS